MTDTGCEYDVDDLVVYESSNGYTTVGRISKVPPYEWGPKDKSIEETDRVEMRMSPIIPMFTHVHLDDIIGLRENTKPDVETHDW